MFSGWLSATDRLQRDYFGVDFNELRSTPEALADYLLWNNLAARDELSEVLDEMSWKPWSMVRGTFNKQRVMDELVDVLHFIANIACACGISDGELTAAYHEKMEINRKRQISKTYVQRGFNQDETGD